MLAVGGVDQREWLHDRGDQQHANPQCLDKLSVAVLVKPPFEEAMMVSVCLSSGCCGPQGVWARVHDCSSFCSCGPLVASATALVERVVRRKWVQQHDGRSTPLPQLHGAGL